MTPDLAPHHIEELDVAVAEATAAFDHAVAAAGLVESVRTVAGQPETYSYLALYWTWGPKDAKDDADKSGGGAAGMMQRIHFR